MNLKIKIKSEKNFLKNIKIFFFLFCFWGYPFISIFIVNPDTSRLITIPYRGLVLFLCVLIFVFSDSDKKGKNNLFNKLLLIFIVIYSLRILIDITDNTLVFNRSNIEYLTFWFLVSLIPSAAFFKIKYFLNEGKTFLISSWILTSFILVLLYIRQNTLSLYSISSGGRLEFASLNPISVGHLAASVVILSLWLFFQTSFKRSFMIPILGFCIILGIYFLLFSASRGPLLSCFLAIAILIISRLFNSILNFNLFSFNNLKYLVLFVFAASIITSIYSSVKQYGINLDRLEKFNDQGESSRTDRIGLALRLVIDNVNFVAGYGLELPNNLAYPHNLIVESFLATGLLGGIPFLIVYIFAFLQATKLVCNHANTWGWLGLLYIQYSIGAMFSGSLYASYTFWYLLFIIFSLNQQNLINFKNKKIKTNMLSYI